MKIEEMCEKKNLNSVNNFKITDNNFAFNLDIDANAIDALRTINGIQELNGVVKITSTVLGDTENNDYGATNLNRNVENKSLAQFFGLLNDLELAEELVKGFIEVKTTGGGDANGKNTTNVTEKKSYVVSIDLTEVQKDKKFMQSVARLFPSNVNTTLFGESMSGYPQLYLNEIEKRESKLCETIGKIGFHYTGATLEFGTLGQIAGLFWTLGLKDFPDYFPKSCAWMTTWIPVQLWTFVGTEVANLLYSVGKMFLDSTKKSCGSKTCVGFFGGAMSFGGALLNKAHYANILGGAVGAALAGSGVKGTFAPQCFEFAFAIGFAGASENAMKKWEEMSMRVAKGKPFSFEDLKNIKELFVSVSKMLTNIGGLVGTMGLANAATFPLAGAMLVYIALASVSLATAISCINNFVLTPVVAIKETCCLTKEDSSMKDLGGYELREKEPKGPFSSLSINEGDEQEEEELLHVSESDSKGWCGIL